MKTNYTKLADLYAIAKAEEEKATAVVKELKKQIVATGQEFLEGDAYRIKVSLSETTRASVTKARQLLTQEQFAAITSKSITTDLAIKAALSLAA